MRQTLDHDIRAWLTAEEYLGAVHAADAEDRTLSGYIRHLIRADLAVRASAMAALAARSDPGAAPSEPPLSEAERAGRAQAESLRRRMEANG
jgi:hypothetical protein